MGYRGFGYMGLYAAIWGGILGRITPRKENQMAVVPKIPQEQGPSGIRSDKGNLPCGHFGDRFFEHVPNGKEDEHELCSIQPLP